MSETRTIRYNRSPDSHAARCEGQRNRVLPDKTCTACDHSFTPQNGYQKRCRPCIAAKRYP